jgi:hypothetical protein
MQQPRTLWPLEERIRLVAVYDELRKQSASFSARQFSAYHEVPYATFTRWLARFRRAVAASLRDRSQAPKRRPHKLSRAEETVIRRAHKALGCGVHRLYFYLRVARAHDAQLRQRLPGAPPLRCPRQAQAEAQAQLADVRQSLTG